MAARRASASANASGSASNAPNTPTLLPTDREISSIPRADGEKWVYPSQAQFYAAMARKRHDPRAEDMRVVVPIHNAVNERAWREVLGWEEGYGYGGNASGTGTGTGTGSENERCEGPKLVSFKGRPNDRTPRAWFYSLLGYVGVLYWPITHVSLVTSLRTDIHHHSIAMTG